MDMFTMGTAAVATPMPATTAQGGQSAAQSTELSFASVLNAMNSAAGQTSGQTWRDIEANLTNEALKAVLGAEKPQVTDPVLAQLLEMLKALGKESGEDSADLAALVAKMQKRLREMLEEDGQAAASQQVMALMAQVMPMMTAMGGAPAQDGMVAALSQNGAEALQDLWVNAQPKELVSLLTGRENAAATDAPDFAALLPVQAKSAGTQADAVEGLMADAVSVQVQKAPAAQNTVDFAAAVRAAKQQMEAAEAPAAPKAEVDVDALQKQVDAGTFIQNTALAGTQTAEAPEVVIIAPPAVQLQQGVETALLRGDETLSIKLAPEGLGEVIIRLAHTAEGMKLDIIAKSAETQKLLAGQMDQLRESLRPLKVEVDSIVTQSQYEMLANSQHQGEGRRQGFFGMRGAAYYGDEPLGEVQGAEAAVATAAAPEGALNAYV